MRLVKSSLSLAVLWLFSAGLSSAATITFTIDPSSGNSPITPYTFGSNSTIPGVKNTYYRSGGNRLTAYNWETNWSNCGSDCNAYPGAVFENDTLMGDVGDGPAGAFTTFHQANKAAGADSLVTLQLAGRVAADKAGPVPVSLFAPPDSPRFFPALLAKPGAPGSYADPPVTTDGVVYVDECVNYLVNHLGKADNGGVRFYDLDNEPGIWSGTHQEIRNNDPATYAELAASSATIAYQTTAIDPGAKVLGPVGYGWGDFINLQGAPDAVTYDATYDNGNWVPFLNYYLASMNSASVTAGRRLLHYLDSHVYSEGTDAAGKRINNDDVSQDAATTRMQLPRELWDPTFTETNWISCCVPNYGPMTLIPRLQAAINQYYPGTKIAFTEYSYGGGGDISGGIAEADALGIFGKYGVMASQWNTSSTTPYLTCAFNLYLDYDGSGSHFGDTAVSASTSNVPLATVYAARDNSHPNRLNVIVLNKDYSTNDSASVTFTGLGGAQISSIRAFRFSSGVSVITAIAAPVFTVNTLTDTLPFRSATLYELTLTQPFATATPTITGTSTRTPTVTPTGTATPTATASPTGTLPTATFTSTRTWTPTATSTSTRTYSPTPTVVCTNLFNGCEADGVNGTWSGIGATRAFVTTNKTQGTNCMQVNLPTNSGWNNQIMNLTGFTPVVWSGVSQVVMDVFVSSSLISTGSTYHQFTLQADSASYGQQPIADYQNVNANSNTVTFNISFAGAQFDPSTPLTKLWFVFNTDSIGTGSFYVDNIRLVQACNVTYTPTLTPTVTATCTVTYTTTASSTSTATMTVSMTSTPMSSGTSTATSTVTPSRTPTDTPSPTATPTVTSTSTSTSSATSTATWTETYPPGTYTPTSQPTATVTKTPTSTATVTWTSTTSSTDTTTALETATWTPMDTPTATSTPSATLTLTPVFSPTSSATSTSTGTASRTSTFTVTATSTMTSTPTPTSTASRTATSTATPSVSPLPTLGSPTATSTDIPSSPRAGIYPNPAINVGVVTLSVPSGKVNEAVGVKVFTVASRLVRKTVLTLDARKLGSLSLVDDRGKPLASGLYLVAVTTSQGRVVERLVVLR